MIGLLTIQYVLVWASVVYRAQAEDPVPIWFHRTCSGPGLTREPFREVIKFGKVAYTRLNPAVNDLNQETYYMELWKQLPPVEDYTYDFRIVRNVMARVGNLFTVRGQLGALIRVYCDNDARWQLKPDRPNDPDPNSQRGNPNQQEWIDPSNHLSHIGPTCATNPLMVARTYKTPYDDADGDNDFENRVTITICQFALDQAWGVPTLDGFNLGLDQEPKLLESFEPLWSKILFQQIAQSPHIDPPDAPVANYNPPPAALAALELETWTDIVTSDWPTLHNPYAYSWFALGGSLGARHWGIDQNNLDAGRLIVNLRIPQPWTVNPPLPNP